MKRLSLVLILVLFNSAGSLLGQDTKPAAESQTIITHGLAKQVTIRRDNRGIPYIEASTEADLYFAQGYVTASDRLWQMDLLRRRSRGQLAEIFGAAALEDDKLHRRYGFGRVADEMVSKASPETLATMKAFAAGVNAYIDSLTPESMPIEFRLLQYKPQPWTPSDSFAVLKNFSEALSVSWPADILRTQLQKIPDNLRKDLFPTKSDLDVIVVEGSNNASGSINNINQPVAERERLKDGWFFDEALRVQNLTRDSLSRVGLYAEEHAASNNWVVSGKHTVSGMPLLANDPHLDASAPSIWYLVNLTCPGLHVAGVTTPGLPGVVIGHNENIAWGMTNLGPDVQDLYAEKFEKESPTFYSTPAGRREAKIVDEKITVRKSLTGTETEVVNFPVTITRHGPIVMEKDGIRYALRWTALETSDVERDAIYALDRAQNWKEFTNALTSFTGPAQNFIFADKAGHIGYYGAGKIPIRKSGDGSTPYDGSSDAGEWTSYIPFERLPHSYDPQSGIIVTANQRVIGDSYPYFLSNLWATPYRARRIFELLKSKPKMSVDDFREIQGDTYSYPAHTFAREFVKTMGTPSPANESAKTFKLLADWDGKVNSDSRAALLAVLMRDNFRRRVIEAALGPDMAKIYAWPEVNVFVDRVLAERDPVWLPKVFKSYSELFSAVEQDARTAISKKLGEDETKWTWGNYGSFRFPHPLAPMPLIGKQFSIPAIPQNGSISSINVGNAVSMRFIADPSNWDQTRHGITLGESGNPASPFWSDQLPRWSSVDPERFPFGTAEVIKSQKSVLVLRPN
jgi:penicillin amidase